MDGNLQMAEKYELNTDDCILIDKKELEQLILIKSKTFRYFELDIEMHTGKFSLDDMKELLLLKEEIINLLTK